MRNFKIEKRKKPIFISKAAFVNMTLLTGVLVFVALAALTGKAFSENVLKDIINDHNDDKVVVSDDGKDTPVVADDTVMTVSIDGREYYIVQFGMFTSSKNAETCASSISAMGGAGYIKQINGNYYVFAMCYSNLDDAKTVVANLKSQGYSTIIKSFSHNGLEMKLKGNEIGISSIDAAMTGMIDVLDELENVIYKFDGKETDRVATKKQLQKILEDVETYRDVFNRYKVTSDNETISEFEKAEGFCSTVYSEIATLLKAEDDKALSSGLKYTYINTVFNLIQCLDK